MIGSATTPRYHAREPKAARPSPIPSTPQRAEFAAMRHNVALTLNAANDANDANDAASTWSRTAP
jgi:hypothetical protein